MVGGDFNDIFELEVSIDAAERRVSMAELVAIGADCPAEADTEFGVAATAPLAGVGAGANSCCGSPV